MTAHFHRGGGELESCPNPGEDFYGQDIQYSPNPISLTANADGTVQDHVTTLLWQRHFDQDALNYDAAVLYCDNLSLAGHEDWRLPTRKELFSLVDYSWDVLPIDDRLFPYAGHRQFWTITERGSDATRAWCVDFGNGEVRFDYKTDNRAVRCVR